MSQSGNLTSAQKAAKTRAENKAKKEQALKEQALKEQDHEVKEQAHKEEEIYEKDGKKYLKTFVDGKEIHEEINEDDEDGDGSDYFIPKALVQSEKELEEPQGPSDQTGTSKQPSPKRQYNNANLKKNVTALSKEMGEKLAIEWGDAMSVKRLSEKYDVSQSSINTYCPLNITQSERRKQNQSANKTKQQGEPDERLDTIRAITGRSDPELVEQEVKNKYKKDREKKKQQKKKK